MTPDRGGRWRDAAALIASLEAIAVAIWLLPASVHIVRWGERGPERLALLGSRAGLLWLVGGAFAVAAGVIVLAGKRRLPTARIAPLMLLWLWAIPYLPWLPDQAPLLLVFAGPVRWVVAAVAAAGALGVDRGVRALLADERRLPGRKTIFAVSLALYVALGLQSAVQLGPGGDEPHYLIISQSLLADGDLKIENNHQARQYASFFKGDLRPDYLTRGADGEIYSVHAPGLPVLLLPVYAVAGYLGCVVFICLIGALAALAIFDLSEALGGRRAALLTWVAACLTIPFVPHSWLIFPEVVGALLVAWAALWIWRDADRPSVAAWGWRGAALAVLPWLHTKFAIFLGVFATVIVLRMWRRRFAAAVAFSVPIFISLAAWFGFFYVIYGTLSPTAAYGQYRAYNIYPANIPRGLLGLMFDQKFGLLFYTPVYLFAIAGAWKMLRRRDLWWLGGSLLVATALFVGQTTELYMWWGGNSAPARFLVPIVPCLAPMIALAIADSRRTWSRALFGAWLALSLAVAAAGVGWPDRFLIFSVPHGRARLLQVLEAGSPLALSYPTFTELDWRTPLLALVPWLAAAGVGLAAIVVLARWTRRSLLWLGTAGAVASLVAAGFLAPTPPAAREATAMRGALAVMARYEPARLRALDYVTMRRADPQQVLARSLLVSPLPAGPWALPPGRYEARVWFTGARGGNATVVVSAPAAEFARASGPVRNPMTVQFDLPVAIRQVGVTVDDAAAAADVARVELAPLSIVPASERSDLPVRSMESVEDRPGAYILYMDDNAYPEGGVFWTRGTEPASVRVVPAGASQLILTLFAGPRDTALDLTVGDERRTVTVPAGAVIDEAFAISDPAPVPVTVRAQGAFRPSEVDASSGDTRLLGGQVRIHLR